MSTVNRILSALLGLALLIVGILVVITMIVVASGRQPTFIPVDSWYDWLRRTRLEDGGFLAVAAGAAVIGLILVVLELRPWPPDRVQTSAANGTPLWISRRSVEHRVNAAAGRAGVERARSRIYGKPGRWRLRLRGVARPDHREIVHGTIRTELDRLHAPPDIPMSLALHRPPRMPR